MIIILTKVILIMARELNRQLQELQIQLKRNRAKIAEDAQQLEVAYLLVLLMVVLLVVVVLTLKILWRMPSSWRWCWC